MSLNTLQSPPHNRECHLDLIPVDASVQGMSLVRSGTPIVQAAPIPSWVTNPPVEYVGVERSSGIEYWGLGIVCILFFDPFDHTH